MTDAISLQYDGLLAAVPVFVAGGTAAGWWLAVPTLTGGVLAAFLVAISLFVVPPRR